MNRPLPPSHERIRQEVRAIAWLLDSAVRVPGTRFRFGLEPIIGLLPVAGDVTGAAVGFYLVFRAVQLRLPGIVIARMLANIALDATVGAIPLIGDVFDFAYKSNTRNIRLIEDYAADPERSTTPQWIFFLAILAIVAITLFLIVQFADSLLADLSKLI